MARHGGGDARDWDVEGYRSSILFKQGLRSRTVFRTAFAPPAKPNPNPQTLAVASSDGSLAAYSILSCISASHQVTAVGGYGGLVDVISQFGSHLCTFCCRGMNGDV